MNHQKPSKEFIRAARMIVLLLAGIFSAAPARAQTVPERFLFVFDTSAAMKKRLPGVEKAIDSMLVLSLGGRLHAGDEVGVWTFGHDLHTGEFPLQPWLPGDAAKFASQLKAFLHKQHYAKDTSFDALQPLLNQVVRNSERLTVLIFCDGRNEISWTPYDTGINQLFHQRQTERQKSLQPFVLVLRSQRGEFVGCAVAFPPDAIDLPGFPPLPAPTPTPLPAPVVPPVVIPAIPTPPLIIIGTKVGTNLPLPETKPVPASPPVTNVVVTNAPPPMMVKTNAPVLALTNLAAGEPTNEPPNSVAKTNAVVSPEKSASRNGGSLVIGAILLAVAGALVFLVLRRPGRADRSSLITRSMNQKK